MTATLLITGIAILVAPPVGPERSDYEVGLLDRLDALDRRFGADLHGPEPKWLPVVALFLSTIFLIPVAAAL